MAKRRRKHRRNGRRRHSARRRNPMFARRRHRRSRRSNPRRHSRRRFRRNPAIVGAVKSQFRGAIGGALAGGIDPFVGPLVAPYVTSSPTMYTVAKLGVHLVIALAMQKVGKLASMSGSYFAGAAALAASETVTAFRHPAASQGVIGTTQQGGMGLLASSASLSGGMGILASSSIDGIGGLGDTEDMFAEY